MNISELQFNQALHGYQDGHSLICSSIELDSDSKRTMLPLSDLSGGSIEKGFEEYITGYPLKGMSMYAIAKTWYAPEMRRPGCVWTHTLLINFTDLSKVSNLSQLLAIFKRPDGNKLNAEFYSEPIFAPAEISVTDRLDYPLDFSAQYLRAILTSLYCNEDPVFIKTTGSRYFDTLFLMLWRQQWPRLKRNFSFCSGSIAPRLFKGKLLDIQSIPASSDIFRSELTNISLIQNTENSSNYTVSEQEDWIGIAVSDLLDPSEKLRRFFNVFGSDTSINRSTFRNLLETYLFFDTQSPTIEKCIGFLAAKFPSTKDAGNLKVVILGELKNPFPGLLPKYYENAVLVSLGTTRLLKPFDFEKLNYTTRFVKYFSELDKGKIELLKAIIRMGPNFYAETAITQLSESLEFNHNLHSLFADKQLSTIFIRLNPRLAFNKEFWSTNISSHGEVVSQLKNANLDIRVWERIVDNLIEAGFDIDTSVFDSLEINVSVRILDRLELKGFISTNNKWINHLSSHQGEVLEWMKTKDNFNVTTAFLLVDILSPNSVTTVSFGLDPWLRYLENNQSSGPDKGLRIHAFVVALAFNINNVSAQRAFELCLEHVYFSLYDEKLDYYIWKEIELHTKPLSFWKDWDKCKKLINAVVDKYIRMSWSIKELTNYIEDSNLSDRLLLTHRKRL